MNSMFASAGCSSVATCGPPSFVPTCAAPTVNGQKQACTGGLTYDNTKAANTSPADGETCCCGQRWLCGGTR